MEWEGRNSLMDMPTEQTLRRRILYRPRSFIATARLQALLAVRRGDRMSPHIFIVGAQKAGTTSLFRDLANHAQIIAPVAKEIHQFDRHKMRPLDNYLAHFPSLQDAEERMRRVDAPVMTMDCTPYYFMHPQAAERISAFCPDAKIIVMLRDPCARAWSHYWHEVARGFETLEPEAAFAAEAERIIKPHDHVGPDKQARFAHQHYSYCARSEYDVQISRWQALFRSDQLLFIATEQYQQNPAAERDRIAAFLAIGPFAHAQDQGRLNEGRYPAPAPAMAAWLDQRLHRSRERTRAMLGADFGWPTWRG